MVRPVSVCSIFLSQLQYGLWLMGNALSKVLGTALLAERERWSLWLPVAVGAGIACYFALPVEPARWAGPAALALCVAAGMVLRRHGAILLSALVCGLVACGFTLAVERSIRVAAPVLDRPTGVVRIEGRIADIEPVERGQHRLVLDHLTLPPLDNNAAPPTKLRIRAQTGVEDLRSGQRIALRAELMPPPAPAAPGGYDFARQAWFQGIGAVGYAVGAPHLLSNPEPERPGERLRLWLANLRHDLTLRIVGAIEGAGLPAGVGWVAAALITAERGPVSPALLQAYRDAGLAHILVIAGMHMSMVAGLVFVAIRGGLAAIPPIALRYPIKKWTALAALLVTSGYLVISGAPVPTQRAFIMNGIVLLAVLIDREAISMRSITWAALAVMVLSPESVIGASFQMSFAAVYGLITGYEAIGPMMARWRRGARQRWVMPGFYVAGILLTTQIAGTATAFYTIFHFNRYATYSLLGNFLAVPLVGFWVMPAALLSFCLLPFGLDGWGWQLMGWGIVCVDRIALWVAALPGATVNLPAMPVSALAIFTLGGAWLCLWKGKWRRWGLAGMAAGILIYVVQQPPDILIDPSGQLMAARAADGGLIFSERHGGKALREFLGQTGGAGKRCAGLARSARRRQPALRRAGLRLPGAVSFVRAGPPTRSLRRGLPQRRYRGDGLALAHRLSLGPSVHRRGSLGTPGHPCCVAADRQHPRRNRGGVAG